MKVGFIGLGTMGRHMAANLQKAGHELRRPRRAARGGRVAHQGRAPRGPTRRAPSPRRAR